MPDKIASVIESAKTNNGVRTVIRVILEAGSTVPPHIHTQFDETFEISQGEMTAITAGERIILTPGQSTRIDRNTVHNYFIGDQPVTAIITLEPGHEGFERAMQVMKGMQEDGTYGQLSTMDKDSYLFLSVIGKLTNTIYTDIPEEIAELLYNKVDFVVKELIEKYCNQQTTQKKY